MIQCFVTFCVEDVSARHVQLLIDELKRRTSSQVSYKVYYDQRIGESLHDFMRDAINESEAILALFGPHYKRRVDDTLEKTGAWQEYSMIISKFDDPDVFPRPTLIPVVWSGGTVDQAFPTEIQAMNPLACNLSGFRGYGSREKFAIPKITLEKFGDELSRISADLLLCAERCDSEVVSRKASHLHDMLQPTVSIPQRPNMTVQQALEIKYEYGRYNAHEFKDLFFTNTRFFRRLNGRSAGLISGRKGSGKTTLVQIRELQAESMDYFPVIDVEVDRWNVHYLIQNNAFKQAQGDFEYVDLDAKFFDYVWLGFVALSMCHSLIHSDGAPSLSAEELVAEPSIADGIRKISNSSGGFERVNYAAVFQLSVNAARAFIQKTVDEADAGSEDRFRLDVITKINIRAYLDWVFGVGMAGLKSAIAQKGDRRFLFCFDRFDTEIQRYRKENIERNSSERAVRSRREIDWLGSLATLVERSIRPDLLSKERDIFEFFGKIRFLIVIPFDRIIELRRSHRDAVAGESIEEIAWQPKELMTMLRKRIQSIYGISEEAIDKDRHRTPQARFYRCVALACPNLPKNVHISIGTKRFEKELFLYVLRHSFFRPRDLLIYYAAILSYYDTMQKRGRKAEIGVIRDMISKETQTIVRFEFIGELRDTWTNIDTILSAFKGRNQVLTSLELERIIGPIDFEFYDEAGRISSLSGKIDFLYEIGFLGFRATRHAGAKKNDEDFKFSFFPRTASAPAFDSPEVLKNLNFAIHPIFIESLFLIVNAKKPVMNLEWSDIEANDRVD